MTTHSHGNATNHPSRAGLTWRHLYWPLAGAALLLPLLAMQVTEEVDWSGADIVLMGALLLGVGGTFELAARMSDDLSYRLGVSGALAAGFLLWVNGAAGIIGTEDNSANLIYGGVLAIALIGVFVTRARPRGMSRAMVAAAAAQIVVSLVAVVGGLGGSASGPMELLGTNGFFAALWAVSALMFRLAADTLDTSGG